MTLKRMIDTDFMKLLTPTQPPPLWGRSRSTSLPGMGRGRLGWLNSYDFISADQLFQRKSASAFHLIAQAENRLYAIASVKITKKADCPHEKTGGSLAL